MGGKKVNSEAVQSTTSNDTFARWENTLTVQVNEAYLWVEQVCVHHSTLDVIQVSVVLECSLQESSFLTQLGNVGTIIVGEHLVAQDCISNLHHETNH